MQLFSFWHGWPVMRPADATAELLESDAEGDDEGEFSWQARRLARAMRMGAEALERSLEC